MSDSPGRVGSGGESDFTAASLYRRHRFPAEIIAYAGWMYYWFNLSHWDIGELLAERVIRASYDAKHGLNIVCVQTPVAVRFD